MHSFCAFLFKPETLTGNYESTEIFIRLNTSTSHEASVVKAPNNTRNKSLQLPETILKRRN